MKILLLGKDGQVGWELQRSLSLLGSVIACGRAEANLEDFDGLRRLIADQLPDVVVNAAAYTAVDKAETEPDRAFRINAEAVGVLAEASRQVGAWLVHYSTDYVFDGSLPGYHSEDAPTNPLSVYGRSKCQGEILLREHNARHLIFRTSWVYSTRGNCFPKTMLRLGAEREELTVVADQFGAPTSAELIADVTAQAMQRVLCDPIETSVAGTYHLAAAGVTNWCDFARFVIEHARANGARLKVSPEGVRPIPTTAYPLPAQRPANSRLDTGKLASVFHLKMPDWRFHAGRLLDALTVER